jgi:putative ABC transport system permease protein
VLASALGAWLEATQQYPVSGLEWRPEELWLVAVALGVGVLAALLPAWRAYRTEVSRTLAQG